MERGWRVHLPTLLLLILGAGFLFADRLTAIPPTCLEGEPCQVCGDGICGGDEYCPEDCNPPYCGDGLCNGYEACSSCPDDCGTCSGPVCGDAVCNGGESCSNCSADCGACPFCGDQVCQAGESCSNCSGDCGQCSVCGDGTCSGGEDCGSCSSDCGVCERPGYWTCQTQWSAYTTERTMQGTHLECGWFNCGDHSHSAGRSWVDIVGGISQTCEDHSTSFYGPNSGEWDMCDQYGFSNQRSTGQQWITGVNQHWDRFPQIGGCPPQPVAHMNHPFMSIYDLDFCFDKQLAGTIYFSNFPLYSTRLAGDCANPYSNVVRYAFTGGDSLKCCGGDQTCQTTEIARYWDWSCAGYSYCEDPQSTCDFNTGECVQYQTQCFQPHCEGGCSNNKLCSDLNVVGTYTCTWYEPPPCRQRYDWCEQGSDCCSGSCFDGTCW